MRRSNLSAAFLSLVAQTANRLHPDRKASHFGSDARATNLRIHIGHGLDPAQVLITRMRLGQPLRLPAHYQCFAAILHVPEAVAGVLSAPIQVQLGITHGRIRNRHEAQRNRNERKTQSGRKTPRAHFHDPIANSRSENPTNTPCAHARMSTFAVIPIRCSMAHTPTLA